MTSEEDSPDLSQSTSCTHRPRMTGRSSLPPGLPRLHFRRCFL